MSDGQITFDVFGQAMADWMSRSARFVVGDYVLHSDNTQIEQTSNRTIGHNIAQMRQVRGLTQQDAAEALGKSRTSVSDIERGIVEISAMDLVRFAVLYNISVFHLLHPSFDPGGRHAYTR